mmetsp:Transcript_42718/g.69276  ORF Transcript_42718/g.69276 Transcript_42718/m.69276 type:complete len:151 (+) Transcript_42718:264-716(+)
MPTAARPAFYALRAFNIELASVRDSVRKTPSVGRLRIQWWRDALDRIYKGEAPAVPVAIALQQAVRRHSLSRLWLERLIDERDCDLDDEQPANVQALEDYAERTASSLLYLLLETQIAWHRDVAAGHSAPCFHATALFACRPDAKAFVIC